jgi:heptosyltransferase-1
MPEPRFLVVRLG